MVEAFEDVRRASGERDAVGAVVFEVDGGGIPCVFRADVFGASIHAGKLPFSDPWA